MIVVDTSVWIDFFRDMPSREVEHLVTAIRSGGTAVPDLVLVEVLQGCDTDREFNAVRREMMVHPVLKVLDGRAVVEAARNYRRLRALGITIRKTIDTLIATRCILDDVPLLFSDRDFDSFVRHLGLRSALGEAGVN